MNFGQHRMNPFSFFRETVKPAAVRLSWKWISVAFQKSPLTNSTKTDIIKETLHKARLTALHAICLQIFRHIAQKSLAIRQYACGISMQSAEKSDYASYAQALCSVSITPTHCRNLSFQRCFLWKGLPSQCMPAENIPKFRAFSELTKDMPQNLTFNLDFTLPR